MKKLFIILFSLLVMLSIVSCQKKETINNIDTNEINNQNDEVVNIQKTLVIYFSRTGEQYTVGTIEEGNTAIVAKLIAEKINADLFEVLPEDDYYPYTYKELTDIALAEQRNNVRPAYKNNLPDLNNYDLVFIGAPVWWGDWPMIMYTLFENSNLDGKTLVPFSTHEGSGLSGFDKKLENVFPNSKVLKGLAIRGNDAQNKKDDVSKNIDEWLNSLDY